jgi:hypothetical protein
MGWLPFGYSALRTNHLCCELDKRCNQTVDVTAANSGFRLCWLKEKTSALVLLSGAAPAGGTSFDKRNYLVQQIIYQLLFQADQT